ncbi:hypothetical protein ACFSSA_07540 [Luteolibacter algae]|uniref:Cobalt transporter n=1 Tax=Luteolibacter algae TaxID=454151 RepID=A0ABW5D618_9BACT
MNIFVKILLTLCVFAGFSAGMAHKYIHSSHDECAMAHASEAGKHSHNDDGDEGKSHPTPHHHECCHAPSADFPKGNPTIQVVFQTIYVEHSMDHSMIPDGPVYSLDKPPLI